MREVLLGRDRIAKYQVDFAEMLVGTVMARIEHQRLLVMSDRRPHLAQTPIGIANVVLNVGISRVAQRGKLERCDCGIPILCAERLLASLEIGGDLRTGMARCLIKV